MTYSEYRHTFAKPDEFIRAFGSLSEEEAKELVRVSPLLVILARGGYF